jgi:hypothetical protein
MLRHRVALGFPRNHLFGAAVNEAFRATANERSAWAAAVASNQ